MNMATIAMVECSNVGGCWPARDIDDEFSKLKLGLGLSLTTFLGKEHRTTKLNKMGKTYDMIMNKMKG